MGDTKKDGYFHPISLAVIKRRGIPSVMNKPT